MNKVARVLRLYWDGSNLNHLFGKAVRADDCRDVLGEFPLTENRIPSEAFIAHDVALRACDSGCVLLVIEDA